MLISCPECDAGYEVPDALLRNARMMRCAACGHDWMTEPLNPDAKTAPAENGPRPSSSAPARPSPAGGPVTHQISCPNCDAVYDIPAVMLTSPRSMRCATCGHDWVTAPIGSEPAPAASPSTTLAPPPASPPPAAAAAPAPTPPPPVPPPPEAATTPPSVAPAAQAEAPTGPTETAVETEAPSAGPDAGTEEALTAAERAELEAMRAAQATSEKAEPEASFKDRLQGGLRANAGALIGWAASIAMLYFAARGAIDHRETLVQLWPPGQRIFNWLGFS